MADSDRRHPVLLYIHGESYDWGSGNPYDGSVLASYTDQVIVTMNYRLGVLGFLNANVAPQTKARVANYGLMDQIAALHWVKEHIGLFGGDPNNVTLMGQGTGAACVHFLAISPTVVRGLFKRAILLSGSALSSWAVVEDPVSYALKLARAVNCSVPEDLFKDNELIVDCLRERSLEELMQVDIQPPTFLSAFGPSVDGVVIKPEFQKDLLSYMGPEFQGFGPLPKKAEHGTPITSNNKYDLLFGVTTSEALWKFAEKDVQQGFEGERRDRIIRTYVRNAYVYHLTEIFYTVVNEYTDWERTVQHPMNTKEACVQALSDAQFVAPLVQTGDLFTLRHTKKPNNPHIAPIPDSEKEPLPKTYFYVFDYQMKDGDYPQVSGNSFYTIS
ncbi:nlg-1 [Anthophora plagiata]